MGQLQRGVSLVIFILILTVAYPLLAKATTADPDEIQQQIKKTQQEISNQKKREKSVLSNLLDKQQKLSHLESNYQQTKQKLGVVQTKVKDKRKELSELQNNLGTLQSNLGAEHLLLNKQLVALYKNGPQNYLAALFVAKDFADFVFRFDMVADYVKNDIQTIENIENTKTLVDLQKEKVETKTIEVESEYQKTLSLQDQLANEKQKVLVQVGTTQDELQNIQSNRQKLEQALGELEQTSQEIQAEIRQKEKSNPSKSLGTGNFIWPVRGPITSPFGWRFHPILNKRLYHSGLDIAVDLGTPVHAANAGVVVVSGWQGGYGNFVAIDHGNGISTCYGHNSKLLVKEGDRVYKGQVISLAGSTGLSTGPHVHFEVRRNGEPVDPYSYLP